MKDMDKEGLPEFKSKDTIEIPIGGIVNSFAKMRENPWIVSTIAVTLVLLGVLFFGGFGGGMTGNVINENTAGQNLIDFVNAQGNGEATLVSVDNVDGAYQVVVNFQGQDIPVFVSLDGKYLISDRIPLTGDSVSNTNSGSVGTNAAPKDVQIGDSPTLGSADAKVTIIEFTDYECPFCERHYTQTYKQLKKDYIDTGKVLYVLKNFPLSFHPEAQKAAESALCVREQLGNEGYFKMHDKLFDNQQSLSVENEKKWARELGVDGTKFDLCLDSGKFADVVKEDESYGQSLGVSGTPSSFINGIPLEGAVPYSSFKQIIDSELAK